MPTRRANLGVCGRASSKISSQYVKMERVDHSPSAFSQPVLHGVDVNRTTVFELNSDTSAFESSSFGERRNQAQSCDDAASVITYSTISNKQANNTVEIVLELDSANVSDTFPESAPGTCSGSTYRNADTRCNRRSDLKTKAIVLVALSEFFSSEGGQSFLMKAFISAASSVSPTVSAKPPAAEIGSYITNDKMITLEEKICIGSQERDLQMFESDSRYLGEADLIVPSGRPEKIRQLCQQLNKNVPLEQQQLLDPEIKDWLIYLIKKNYCNMQFAMRSDTPEPIRIAVEQAQKSFISNAITKGVYSLKQRLLPTSLENRKTKSKKRKADCGDLITVVEEATGCVTLQQ